MASLRQWVMAVLAAGAGFILAPILWAVGTGLVAGGLDIIGIHIPAATFLSVPPLLLGLVGAVGGVMVVMNG